MKKGMHLSLSAAATLLFSTFFSPLSASNHNIYFADPGSGIIYGMADDDIGEDPVIVSGQLSINAWEAVRLETDQWMIVPQYHRDKIVEVDLTSGNLSVINELPEGWKISSLSPGLESDTVIALVTNLTDQKISLYQGIKQNGSWSFSLIGPEIDEYEPSRNCVVHQIDANRYLTYYSSAVKIIDTTSPPTYSEILNDNSYQGIFIPTQSQNFFVIYERFGEKSFHDYTGALINPEEENSYLFQNDDFSRSMIFWNENSPVVLGRAINQLFVDDPPYSSTETPEMVYSAHSGDGSVENPVIYDKDISYIASLYREGANTWDYYDQLHCDFRQVDIENDTLGREIVYEFGAGPDLGSVMAMNTADNGLIHALCLKDNAVQIIAVDPSTGSRALVVDQLPNLFHPEIRANSDRSYSLFMEDSSDDDGTLNCYTEIVELIPGASPSDYTINTIASFKNEDYSPQDVVMTGINQGTILFPKNQGVYYTYNIGSEFTSFEGIPVYARTQTCRLAVPSPDNILLYANRPPALWSYQPLISNMSQTQLTLDGEGELPSELAYPSDLVQSPDGQTLYLSCYTTTEVYQIDSITGIVRPLTSGQPSSLSGELWGESPANTVKICCGPYLELPNGNTQNSRIAGWNLF